ncbi:hypothetical protein COLO4_02918 [Corchorus olitorius]|uniref:Uncharacterized protein n=1 Tax=Corchorus olitorius TaxID=93759 RepID=A0A1R3L033_9ROSI|nr:hypothetical protein COLO4_02918 [Corchorus olitorius]
MTIPTTNLFPPISPAVPYQKASLWFPPVT